MKWNCLPISSHSWICSSRGIATFSLARLRVLVPAEGGPRSCAPSTRSVTSITRRFVGVPINPHLFRHLTATMFLERRPGDYETVRRTLTHTSLDQAHQSYIGVDDRAAVRRFDEVILEAREEALPSLRRGRTRAPAVGSAIKSRKRKEF